MTIRAFEYEPLPSAAPPAPLPNANELTDKYRELRDRKSAIELQMKSAMKPLTEEMVRIEGELMNLLNATGAQNINTPSGTAYKSETRRYSVDDPHILKEWAEANGRSDIFENRVSKEAMDAFIEAHGTLPPGVKLSTFVTVNIRASK
jgi:hypothetical protein